MGLKGKLMIETQIKGSAEKYYSMMKTQAHQFQTISPHRVGAVELHHGDWHDHGAIKLWTYTINGKTETVKEVITHDDKNKAVTLTAVDGDVMKSYKSYKGIFQAIPGCGGATDMVRLTVEYEKIKDTDPSPIHYFDFLVNLFIEEFDAYLANA